MAVLMRTLVEIGREERSPECSTRFSVGVKDEQAETGWDSPTIFAKDSSI